ncbi:MAG: hypothetical protein Q7S87_04730 [Agitococcus sp.]|nr:hypothetical protein [Agitococcus sp.]
MESGLTPVALDRQPCINLAETHFRRRVGDFAVFGTWYRYGDGKTEPCLVITLANMFDGKPAVIPLSAAYKYSQMAFAPPLAVAQQVREFATGFKRDNFQTVVELTDLINDSLTDLYSMPPDYRARRVVADADIVIDGCKKTVEVIE